LNQGRTVFAQLISFLSYHEFERCVARYDGNKSVRSFSCWDQLLTMLFAQLTYRESLRDIEVCLRAHRGKLYHSGLSGPVKRSTLADANETRDSSIYADFAQSLIQMARQLYADTELGIDLDATLYALDSTTIDLCLSLFPWAQFRRAKSAIKLHTLMEIQSSMPVFIAVTPGRVHDVKLLDAIIPEPGSFFIMDRAYVDFARLHRIQRALAFFVIRAKENLQYKRRCSRSHDRTSGVRSDQTIVLTGPKSSRFYPTELRRVTYHSLDPDQRFVFLTNNFLASPQTIAALYKHRWRIELFFKWIKQHLRIKKFYGNSLNSVKTQVWTAVSVYALVAIIKKRLGIQQDIYTILQVLSLTLFEKTPIFSLFENYDDQIETKTLSNQLSLLDI
jgi:transposase